MKTRSLLLVVFAMALLGGSFYIMSKDRPVNQLDQNTSTNSTTESPSATNPEEASTSDTYTLADVESHATVDDCWSAINGSVYDLTTWVSRHPGGENPIKGLCGKDGSAAFSKAHNNAPKPQSALMLLKIGELK